jgi:hypothetical protein
MKMFLDLVFFPHPNFMFGGTLAQIFFGNGYGVSVTTGGSSYTTEGTYELAVLKGTKDSQKIVNMPDHEGIHLTKMEVTNLMRSVQELPHA